MGVEGGEVSEGGCDISVGMGNVTPPAHTVTLRVWDAATVGAVESGNPLERLIRLLWVLQLSWHLVV